jgi:hypothetical protein
MMLSMERLIHTGTVEPAAKPAKSVEQASRRPPLVAKASQPVLGSSKMRCHHKFLETAV